MSTIPEDHAATDALLGSTPSREETETPGWVRLAGTIGTVCFAAGLIMYVVNVAADLRSPPPPSDAGRQEAGPWKFRPAFVTLFQLVGLIGLLIQAGREREAQPRRMLGLLGVVLFALGALFLTNVLASEGVKAWLLAGGTTGPDVAASRGKWAGLAVTIVMAVVFLFAWVAPFVRSTKDGAVSLWGQLRLWVTHMGEPRVSAMTLYGAVGLAVLTTIAYLLKSPLARYGEEVLLYSAENLVPFGLGTFGVVLLLLGLPFLLIFSRTEEDAAWARVPASLLVTLGTAAMVVGLLGVFVDLLGVPDYTHPYAVGLALLGLLFLCLYVTQRRVDSDTTFHVAKWMGYAGLIALSVAAVRSLLPSVIDTAWMQDTFEALEGVGLPSYLVPNGFLYLTLGAAFAFFGWTLSSDRTVFVLTRKELGGFFTSAIGYIVIGGTVVVSGVVYWNWVGTLDFYTRREGGAPEPVVQLYLFSFFMVVFLLIAVPMLTMRLLSEEHRGGTLEVLLTAPVDESGVVVSKVLGAWIFYLVMILIWASFPLILRVASHESFDVRPVLSCVLGMAAFGFHFVAMGVFFSGLTRNQIVAFLLTFAGMLLQLMLFFLERSLVANREAPPSPTLLEAIRYASWVGHLETFSTGKIYFKHLLFHLTFGAFWMFLTVRVLESRKWR